MIETKNWNPDEDYASKQRQQQSTGPDASLLHINTVQ